MKEGNSIKWLFCAWVLGAMACTSVASPLPRTGEVSEAVPKQIADLRDKVNRAVVIVGVLGWSFNRVMHEKDLPTIGCTYTLEDGPSIASLMDVLAKGQFVDDPTPEDDVNVRLGIYLYKPDGTKAALIFERTFIYEQGGPLSTGDVRGTYNHVPVVAKAPFEQEVRNLVRRMKPTKTTYDCESDRQ